MDKFITHSKMVYLEDGSPIWFHIVVDSIVTIATIGIVAFTFI